MLPCTLLSFAICVLTALAAVGVRRARFLDVNPRYRKYLEWHGLNQVEDFLALPAVIVSGHPNRNVAQVCVGPGASPLRGYLKREHQIYWRDYFANAWAGFGWVSRSYRESMMLQELRRSGVRCPEVIAAGQDGRGRAFLLVRDLAGAKELRTHLLTTSRANANQRRTLARRLGKLLAHIHAAGFIHGDLNATHVLVDGQIHLLDWQRSRWLPWSSWRRRLHDLAGLDATLAEGLVGLRDRLACLRSYLRESLRLSPHRWPLALQSARDIIARRSRRLLQKRYIRELRQPPLPAGTQNLVWLDGEALCVTRDFHARLDGRTPDWLSTPPAGSDNHLTQEQVHIPGTHSALLVRRRARRPWHWLWSLLRGKSPTSPELIQAAALFRLQRYGVEVPRLLAVGQRHLRPWKTESFLLTEPPATRVGLSEWLATHAEEACFIGEHKRVRRVLVSAGRVLRRLHEAGCYLDAHRPGREPSLLVLTSARGLPAVVLGNVNELHTRRRPSPRRARRDLSSVCRQLAPHIGRRTDALRFLRAYAGRKRLSAADKRLVRNMLWHASSAISSRRASATAK